VRHHRADSWSGDERLGLIGRGGDHLNGAQRYVSASSTRAVVDPTLRDGRASTALPPANADAAMSVGTQMGELAECHPNTTP